MRFLKAGVATEVAIGPFLDAIDGVTAETALSITNTDVRLKINDANWAAATNGGTHEENGWYRWTIATGEALVGIVTLAVHESGALPVYHDFMVLPAKVYDSLVGGTDNLEADVVQWLGTAAATPTVAGVPEVDVTHLGGSAVDQSGGLINANMKQLSADATAADALELFVETFIRTSGTATAGGASTITLAAGDGAADDAYVGGLIVIIAGTGIGQMREISDYVSATKVATVSNAWDVTPGGTSQYIIFAGPNEGAAGFPTVGQIADGVWDEALAGHLTAGSTGEALDTAATAGDPWATALPGGYAAGEAGYILGNVGDEVVASISAVTYDEPSSAPSWPMSLGDMWRWLTALSRNKRIQTLTQTRLRNDADDADIASSATSDNGSDFTRDQWS